MPTTDELAAEIASLRARVERSEAALAIHALKARYAQLVDERYARGRVASAEVVAARSSASPAVAPTSRLACARRRSRSRGTSS
jgi:hypothetical protein